VVVGLHPARRVVVPRHLRAGLVLTRLRALGGLALLLAAVAGAEPASPAPESPRFTHLSVEDGLSQSSVEYILQDRMGFMWFGTQEGLNRYDGYRFTVHRARDQPGFLGDHTITAVVEDRRRDLWIGTDRGLYRHDLATGRFDVVAPATAELAVRSIVEEAHGRLFVTTADGAFWLLEAAGGGWSARRLESEALKEPVTIAVRGAGSTVWAAGNGRLLRVESKDAGATPQVTEVLRDIGPVRVMASDAAGDVWIGRPQEVLVRYRPADGRVDRFPQVPRGALALLPTADGTLWVGARGGGLTRLDIRTGQVAVYRHDPDDPTTVARDDVAAVYQDQGGTLWVGSWNGGVSRLDLYAQAFRRFRHRPRIPDSLPADDVLAMTETPDGRLWLGSRSGVLAVGDPVAGRFQVVSEPGRVTALGWLGSRVLVGTSTGLVPTAMDSGRAVPLDAPLRAAGLDRRPIAALRTSPGAAWVASGGTVCRLSSDEAGRAMTATCADPPLTSPVTALSIPTTGRLWIGSETGELAVADLTSETAGALPFRRVAPRDGAQGGTLAAAGRITAIHEDAHGRLWLGTRRGLGQFEPGTGTIAWIGEAEGLTSTNISGLAAGADGFVWVGTNSGLTRIDPETGAMAHFGAHEGAMGTGYAEGAWTVGGSGRLYFAGHGVSAFDPREVRVNPHRPGIAFTGLEILRRPVSPRWVDPQSPLEQAIHSQNEVTLKPSATVFSVEMAPLHYADPHSNRLAYRLEGFDPEWIETDARNRVATYTRLAPGRYVLRARARTKNGLWSEGEAVLPIHVLPPWWRTRGAIAGWAVLALLATGLAWAAFRRNVRVRLALQERETLRRESITDPLTGLHNRRFLASHLQHEMPKVFREIEAAGPSASGSGTDLVLLLLDIDHFKAINDSHSHAVGDRVLARIAGVIRDHIRDSDLAVRWGGDEFLVVARSIHRGHATASVERLRAAVEELGRTLAAEGGPACTVSIGYAAFPFLPHEPKALGWEQTLHLADHALLLTKRRQRNGHTGLRATTALTSSAVLEFVAGGGDAALPEGVEIIE
jgi:diguanylate cyclase (GGDEF)-like protein